MWRLLLMFSVLCCSCEGQVTCRDENNGMKDWYILYLEPKQGAQTGLKYTYIDSSGPRNGNKPINDPNGILANTLRPIFKPIQSMDKDFGFISYNDQHRRCNVETMLDHNMTAEIFAGHNVGHSKGVVMVKKDSTGLWLLHSVPQFPFDRDQNNFWTPSGAANGQTFICVTFKYDQFDEIGDHLQYIGACAFESWIPKGFYTELIDAANQKLKPPKTTFVDLVSNGNQRFSSIAKKQATTANDGDLYVTISNAVKSDVNAQTWGRQSGRDCSFCKPRNYKVLNIESVTTPLGSWTASHDHSKWCVATDQNKPWTCIADMNRARSQYERRGGALCINNNIVRNTFRGFVAMNEDCKSFMASIYTMVEKSFDYLKLLVQSSMFSLVV